MHTQPTNGKRPKYWRDPVPVTCHQGHPISDEFFDARSKDGPWVIMCPACHRAIGVGLGRGSGQRYTRQADGRFLRTAG